MKCCKAQFTTFSHAIVVTPIIAIAANEAIHIITIPVIAPNLPCSFSSFSNANTPFTINCSLYIFLLEFCIQVVYTITCEGKGIFHFGCVFFIVIILS